MTLSKFPITALMAASYDAELAKSLGATYSAMILAAVEKCPGSQVGSALSVSWSGGVAGCKFLMWSYKGKDTHTLLCSETTQERLDAHWAGFVMNTGEQARSTK